MKAFEIQEFGGIDGLALVDRERGKPGAGEILLKMKAASLNFRDLITVGGGYGPTVQTPLVPLSDGCGEVVEVGDGVSRVAVGDRVAPIFFQDWIDGPPRIEGLMSSLGGGRDGVAQEFMVVKDHGVVKVPEFMSDEEVACLPCAALTAWRALMVEGGVKAGDRVLLLGTGGVSIFGLQLAKAAGAETIITSSSDEKLERAKALGADHTINYKTHPKWSSEVRALSGFAGVDHILEVGGGATLKESMKSIKVGGHISIIGVVASGEEDFKIGAAIAGNMKLQAISVGSRAQFEDMNAAMALHEIVPVVDQTFGFEELPQALREMQGGAHFGKICLKF